MTSGKVRVLYIASWDRSGSTLLGNLLGEMPGFLHVGELRYVWDRGVQMNALCGCGQPFRACEWWKEIFASAFRGMDAAGAEAMVRLRESGNRTRHILWMLLPAGRERLARRLGDYRRNTEKLYRSLQGASRARVIVDSSKFPSYAYLLHSLQGIELYVVHLVRDPRAVSYSLQRRKANPELGGFMNQIPSWRSSLLWAGWNSAVSLLARSLPGRSQQLRYEDLVANPKRALHAVAKLVGEETDGLPFLSDHVVRLGRQHTLSGNPVRFTTGLVPLRTDDEWKQRLHPVDRWVVSTATWPWLRSYGYRVWET